MAALLQSALESDQFCIDRHALLRKRGVTARDLLVAYLT